MTNSEETLNMNCIKLVVIITSAISVVTAAGSDDSSVIEAKMVQFEAMMRQQQHMIQEQKIIIQELQLRITKIDNKQNSNGQIFDCYRTENWSSLGIIMFHGCSVDTTTSDPWKGTFTIQYSGIYRFTFEGPIGFISDSVDPYGSVGLYVDDKAVASGYANENYDTGGTRRFMVSIDTLQVLEAGQSVSIQWSGTGGAYLYSDVNTYIHFTGHYVTSSQLVPPQCEYTGQTFEYPGSCRKYYLCLADGTIELNDCCPDVFGPLDHSKVGETCVPEGDGGYICNDDDTC